MIHRTEPACQTQIWQQSLAGAITSLEALCTYVQVKPSAFPLSETACRQFSMRIPTGYADLIEKGNPNDPLLRQVLPSFQEVNKNSEFNIDTVGDLSHTPAPGIIQKYNRRALIITTGACAIHCRYCFRRHFPYPDTIAGRSRWLETTAYLQQHPEISEIILSGGDPLTLTEKNLLPMFETLSNIKHLQRLRIHTRIPTVLPERITEELLDLLSRYRLDPIIVIHVNHPNELSTPARQALLKLRRKGLLLLNQSVLLKGVNDTAETIIQLSETLYQSGVLPYYLHMLDRVKGAAHFEVGQKQALEIHQSAMQQLPGYLVPRLVREIEGSDSKLPVSHQAVSTD